VLFPAKDWPGLADGAITVAFRRWKRPTVKASGTLQSPGGLLAIDEVSAIDEADISDEDAVAAGHPSAAAVIASLRPEGQLYRIRFHRLGDDPRIELRQRSAMSDSELEHLKTAVSRLAWARSFLRLIGERPGVVSTELAEIEGLERLIFKQRVRRLKELGLTESLKIGYRLSPRGEALLAVLEAGAEV
jgi:hypothetical protein